MSKKPKLTSALGAPAPMMEPTPPPAPMTKFERLRLEEMAAGQAKLASRRGATANETKSHKATPKVTEKDDEPELPGLELPPAPVKMVTLVDDAEIDEQALRNALEGFKS
jgi:hypothetical protein